MVITAHNIEQKPGYKRTEIGWIPEDWELVAFENIRDKNDKWSITGGPFGSNLKAADYVEGGVRIIQLQNIGDGIFHNDYKIYTTEKKANELLSCNIYPGDIILSKMGDPVARACILPETEKRYLMASDGIRLAVDKKSFSIKFVHDYLNSPYFRNRAFDASTGSTRMRIGLGDLRKLLVVKPSLPEQQAIATALGDVDALIASLDALIAKKRDIKHATMQQLLTGKTRLPGFSGAWEVKKLGERCDFYSGGTPDTSNTSFYDGNISWITSSDLNNGRVREVEGRITKLGFEKSSAKMVEKGTLLLALYGATAGVVAITELNAAINQAVLAIVPQKDDTEFLFQKLTFHKDWLIKTYTQGGQPNLSGQIVKSIEFLLPFKAEQQAIATILSDMDAEIALVEQRRDKTRALKQAMMQELLTGKTRLR